MSMPDWMGRAARLGLIVLSLVALLGSAMLVLAPNPRSFAVQAATRGLTVTVDHAAMSKWLLERALVCFRNDARVSAAPMQDGAVCDPGLYDVRSVRNLELEWASATQLQITRTGPKSPLTIRMVAPGAEPVLVDDRALSRADLVIVPSADWLDNGALTIAGDVRVGSRPGPGEAGIVMSGSYSVSERLVLAQRPVVLARGELFSGDEAQIRVRDGDDTKPAQVFGFIEPRNDGEAGFAVTLYSEVSDSILHVDRFGARGIETNPSWVDRALANPSLLGASAMLALASGLANLGFLGRVMAWAWRRRDANATPPSPAVPPPAS